VMHLKKKEGASGREGGTHYHGRDVTQKGTRHGARRRRGSFRTGKMKQKHKDQMASRRFQRERAEEDLERERRPINEEQLIRQQKLNFWNTIKKQAKGMRARPPPADGGGQVLHREEKREPSQNGRSTQAKNFVSLIIRRGGGQEREELAKGQKEQKSEHQRNNGAEE